MGELRSMLTNANMLALTATATPAKRKDILKVLCMTAAVEISTCLDRPNVVYQAVKAPYQIAESFVWLTDDMRVRKRGMAKTIVYCRSIRACALLYAYFVNELGECAWVGRRTMKSQLFLMYHHSTSPRNKRHIEDVFRNPDSPVRVVIATTAFGLGVDVPDIHNVIHWGASRTFDGFIQEVGRAGRDGNQAYSTIYYHAIDTSVVCTDAAMRTYCINSGKKCRRDLILLHGQRDANHVIIHTHHNCCDICLDKCDCGQCPVFPAHIVPVATDDEILLACSTSHESGNVTSDQRVVVKEALVNLRNSLAVNNMFINASVITGLTDSVIACIANNLHHIHCVQDIMTEHVHDEAMAERVFETINLHM